ncbi:hypothetical protein ACFL2H_08410 [Planctomycetota bacterium]
MTLKHLAAFFMLLCALGCQPSDSGNDASGDGDGGATATTPDVDDTAEVADEPAADEEEQVALVSFKVDGMK